VATTTITTVSGIVEQSNTNGFKLQNRPQWLNYSKFGYQGPTAGQPAPQVGQVIEAQVKQDKFLHALSINGVAPAQIATQTPAPTNTTPPAQSITPAQPFALSSLAQLTIEARQTLLKTVAVAQPNLFVMDQMEMLIEVIRNLEEFVLEPAMAPKEEEITEDDLLDEEDI
jgi:hypothetical protein